MKKIIAILLTITMVLLLTACAVLAANSQPANGVYYDESNEVEDDRSRFLEPPRRFDTIAELEVFLRTNSDWLYFLNPLFPLEGFELDHIDYGPGTIAFIFTDTNYVWDDSLTPSQNRERSRAIVLMRWRPGFGGVWSEDSIERRIEQGYSLLDPDDRAIFHRASSIFHNFALLSGDWLIDFSIYLRSQAVYGLTPYEIIDRGYLDMERIDIDRQPTDTTTATTTDTPATTTMTTPSDTAATTEGTTAYSTTATTTVSESTPATYETLPTPGTTAEQPYVTTDVNGTTTTTDQSTPNTPPSGTPSPTDTTPATTPVRGPGGNPPTGVILAVAIPVVFAGGGAALAIRCKKRKK